MPLPSDEGYVPFAEDPRVLALPQYQELLAINTDPYAPHSRNEDLIDYIEEFIHD